MFPTSPGRSRLRFPAMLLAGLTLLVALWLGFVRLGWRVLIAHPALLIAHGPLMVSGFLGTLISVERAVALGWRPAYLIPLLSGLSALVAIVGPTSPAGALLAVLSSAGLVAISALIARRQPALHTVSMALGAASWLAGNTLRLAGWPIHQIVVWWVGFLVLTIAGERLELSRVLRPGRASQAAFGLAAGLYLVGSVASLFAPDTGYRVAGAGLVATAIWMLRHDIARRTVRKVGLTRFIAACLLSGYAWLLVGGVLWIGYGPQVAGLLYDAMLHAVFLGFVFAVIFGHAPIILPAVLGAEIDYRPLFYAHLALLNASLVLRVGGDLLRWLPGRLWGGLLNIVALLLFLLLTAAAFRRAPRPGLGSAG